MTTTDVAQILLRRGTAAAWTAADPILAVGERGLETDTQLTKLGDGVTSWNSLAYMEEQIAAQIHLATAKTTPADADLIPISDSAASFGLKSLSWANIKVAIFTAIGALTGKTTPVGADTFVISDSAASGVGKSVTWTNILATLLAYFKLYFRRASFRTQATANSTLTLVVGDNEVQEFTGTTAGQIVQQPDVTTLFIGYTNRISNKSTQTIAVNSSGGNLIYTVPAGTDWLFTCNAITGTTASSWSNSYVGASAAPVSASVSSQTAVPGANVAMASANTYYDATSLSLVAGTYLVMGQIELASVSANNSFTGRIWDGTTKYSEGQIFISLATLYGQIILHTIITLASTTTIKLSAQSINSSDTMYINPGNGSGASGTATRLTALKIA